MGTPKEPKPAKYFVGLLSSHSELLASVETDLAAIFGAIDERSETLPWNCSRFYEEEMGSQLLRRFVSFHLLASPGKLADVKLATQHVEEKYRSQTADRPGRSVNLDPGYLEAGKVVLASTKNASQRIYLRAGVFAEATLLYHDGVFHGSSYTYQDYLWPETLSFLTCLRSIYLAQLKQLGELAG